jgi:tetratricopeptide (TPR) repeat protein
MTEAGVLEIVEPEVPVRQETLFAEEGRAHAVTLLTRLVRRREESKPLLDAMLTGRLADLIDPALEVATETGQPLGTALAECFAREGSDELAEWLALRLAQNPYAGVWPLHDLALLATRQFLDRYRKAWRSPGLREREVLAALCHNLGRRLVTLGRAAEALPFLEEALSVYADLGPEKQADHLQCLGTCSEALSQLGRLSEALELAEKAVASSKAQAGNDGQSASVRLTLAGHLINLCGCLADVDRHADALAVIEEAVALYRCHGWIGHSDAYARALLCRGNELHHLGRYAQAADTLEEAIALAADLETDRATAFEPDLALALADLSLLNQQLGRREAAAQALNEAILRYRRLEDRYPESFRPSLAWSLSLLSPDGRKEPASVAARTEAVEHYRQLASSQPGAYEPFLGRSLFDLSESLLAAGELRAALQTSNEAVARLRRVALSRRDLAWSLLLRGGIRAALGHRSKALTDCQQAVELFRQRPAQQAAFYRTDLAVGLHELSIRYHDLGDFAQAIEVTREAEKIYRRLAASAPQIFTEDLASCLNSLSHHLYEAGRMKESVAATRKSIKLYRKVLSWRPEATSGLAVSLSTLAPRLSELGQPAKALQHAAEAVELYRREDDDPEGLATALHSLGTSLLDLERPAEAMPHLEEAVAIRRRRATSQPTKIHDVDLACSLVSLGKSLSEQSRYREALAKTRRGVRLLRGAMKGGGDFLRPRLAATLSNQAHQLRELGEPKAALKSAEEAMRLLTPYVLETPEHYREWITAAVGNYLGAAGETGMEPDMGKVAEIVAALARDDG